eukprot:649285-Pleurochrysis_carterae.AAC.1
MEMIEARDQRANEKNASRAGDAPAAADVTPVGAAGRGLSACATSGNASKKGSDAREAGTV